MVWPLPGDVDGYVAGWGEIAVPRPPCPECGEITWGWSGYRRHLRGDGDRLIRVPRVRCRRCGRSWALVPWFVLPWRWDEAELIGRAIELAAEGWGHRRIAAELRRPAGTVRGWLRRVRRRAEELSRRLLAVAVAWGWSEWEVPTSGLPRLWAAVLALASQWRRQRGQAGPWQVASLVTGGRLMGTNRGAPLAAGGSWGSMAGSITWEEVRDGP
jgi:hypothetical protein